ncbi:unnamed protein product [Leuciscus chuanchicus]
MSGCVSCHHPARTSEWRTLVEKLSSLLVSAEKDQSGKQAASEREGKRERGVNQRTQPLQLNRSMDRRQELSVRSADRGVASYCLYRSVFVRCRGSITRFNHSWATIFTRSGLRADTHNTPAERWGKETIPPTTSGPVGLGTGVHAILELSQAVGTTSLTQGSYYERYLPSSTQGLSSKGLEMDFQARWGSVTLHRCEQSVGFDDPRGKYQWDAQQL